MKCTEVRYISWNACVYFVEEIYPFDKFWSPLLVLCCILYISVSLVTFHIQVFLKYKGIIQVWIISQTIQ